MNQSNAVTVDRKPYCNILEFVVQVRIFTTFASRAFAVLLAFGLNSFDLVLVGGRSRI